MIKTTLIITNAWFIVGFIRGDVVANTIGLIWLIITVALILMENMKEQQVKKEIKGLISEIEENNKK